MANPEHVDVVKQGRKGIAQRREEHPGLKLDLQGADLSRADLSEADLSRANLSCAQLLDTNLHGANLWQADLRQANLSEAHFSEADLSEADLSGANLSGANLWRADLLQANLRDADLSGANLSEANIWRANVIEANVCGANFQDAHISWSVFADVDLSDANALDTVDHLAPSTIGINTLYRSRGRIPEAFLRGCGVPDELIRYLPSLLGAVTAVDFYSCFISYSHADKSFARRLHDALQGRGIRCWLDEHQMLPGDDIHEQVDRGIRLWDKVLLCASKNSLQNSWWVDGEINRAFQKEVEIMKQRGRKVLALIPLNLDGYLFEWESGKAIEVKSRLAADFTGWETDNAKFSGEFEKLVKALQSGDGGREPPPEPKH